MYEYRLGGFLFQDSFRSPPAGLWKWVRENPANHKTEGALLIRLEPGGLMGRGKDARNILVRPLPGEAQSASVSVDTQHESQYEQAGLIVYRDDDNYIKLVRELVDGKTCIILVMEIEASAKVLSKTPLPPGRTWIGLNFKENAVEAVCWGDPQEVVPVGEADFPMDPRPRIGVFSQSGRPDADRWARFTDFVISPRLCEPRKGVE
jgi:regulation of enolase protein 1 (concanavalin A-like superfamily)